MLANQMTQDCGSSTLYPVIFMKIGPVVLEYQQVEVLISHNIQ